MKYITCFLVALSFLTSEQLYSQIGINTIAPDSSAVLHMVSKPGGQGVIIPRITQAQRLGIFKPAKALMVYDLTDKLFYMNLDSAVHNWYAINPWQTQATTGTVSAMYTHSTVTNVGIGTNTPAARLEVVGDIKSTTQISAPTITAGIVSTSSLNVPTFATNALVPTGAIIMWSGTIASIPLGWALCNGTSGTPDLRGRFIVGFDAGSSTTPIIAANNGTTLNYGAIGNKGGEIGHTLLSNESGLPPHTHTNPAHDHSYMDSNNPSDERKGAGATDCASSSESDNGRTTGGKSIIIDNSTPQNASAPHENRPPYYVLAFIIKLP